MSGNHESPLPSIERFVNGSPTGKDVLEARAMRVISGKFRGRPLQVPGGKGVRPTSDRVREALFSVLFERLDGAKVLDLFAGAGSLGIEALSRNASSALFVEPNRAHVKVLERNLSFVTSPHELWPMKAEQALKKLGQRQEAFDLIFLDPPYDTDLLKRALESISRSGLLSPGGCIVCEFRTSSTEPTWANEWCELFTRQYGETTVTIVESPRDGETDQS